MIAPVLATALSPLLAASLAVQPAEAAEPDLTSVDEDAPTKYGPFFEAEPTSEVEFSTQPRPDQLPVLSLGEGKLCFVEDSFCKTSVLLSASLGAGIRAPASDAGPDIPFAQFTFRGGLTLRPVLMARETWHPWAIGVVGSWSKGTGSVTVTGNALEQDVDSTTSTTVGRVAVVNQLWLSKKKHALHLDFAFGAANGDILTSGSRLWGSHAELAMAWGGWGGMYLSGDFLDRDTRFVMGFRGHGIAAAPIIAMALAGLAMGGAM